MHIEVLPCPAAASPVSAACNGSDATVRPKATATGIIVEIFIVVLSLLSWTCRRRLYRKFPTARLSSGRAEDTGSGQQQHADQGERDSEISPILASRVRRNQREQAWQGSACQNRDARKQQHVPPVQHGQPGPAGRHPAFTQVLAGRQHPQARQRLERHLRRQHAGDIDRETGDQHGQSGSHGVIEDARVAQLLGRRAAAAPGVHFAHAHHPRPFVNARTPASNRIAITRFRITDVFITLSKRAPMNAPSIIPITEGTAMTASSAPLLIYTQAAAESTMDRMKPLVPADSLSGTPITRFSTGTLAQPAPSPKTPASTPIPVNSSSPRGVRCACQPMSRANA